MWSSTHIDLSLPKARICVVLFMVWGESTEINPHVFTQLHSQTELVGLLPSPNILHSHYFFATLSLFRQPFGIKENCINTGWFFFNLIVSSKLWSINGRFKKMQNLKNAEDSQSKWHFCLTCKTCPKALVQI